MFAKKLKSKYYILSSYWRIIFKFLGGKLKTTKAYLTWHVKARKAIPGSLLLEKIIQY